MKQMTFQYVGIKKVKITSIGPMIHSKDFHEKWLDKVEKLGDKDS